MKTYIKTPQNRLFHASYDQENSALDKKFYIAHNYTSDASGI